MRRSGALLAFLLALFVSGISLAQQAPPVAALNHQATPAKSLASTETFSAEGNPQVQVWVNTNSGVYHCPATHWYGTTKTGAYMKQLEAQQKGYRPAYHRSCK